MGDPPGDQALVARSRDGDTGAFRELFDRKHRRIYLIAYQIVGDHALAEDIVQEVFLSLWQHCVDYDETLPLDPWLRRIATNRSIDRWRSRKAERSRHLHAAGPEDQAVTVDGASAAITASLGDDFDPQARLGWRQLQAIWDELAAELPPQQRAAFVLRHIEGVATHEVAAALGCSSSTVRSHVAEARKVLRAALSKRYPELVDDR